MLPCASSLDITPSPFWVGLLFQVGDPGSAELLLNLTY